MKQKTLLPLGMLWGLLWGMLGGLLWGMFFMHAAYGAAPKGTNLGVDGEVFPIAEPDLMASIKTELNRTALDGRLDAFNDQLTHQAKRVFTAPPSLGLPRAKASSARHYDPSITLSQDIRTHKGVLIAARGTKINPFEQVALHQPLLFIDGRDAAQMAWMLAQEGKVILTGGVPQALMDKHKRQFFFDQKGVLTARLGITAVPARVSQDGMRLLIETIFIDEEGVDETPINEGGDE